MPYIPYQDAPVKLAKGTPRILQYFQNPKGLLAINLARCEYRNARANGLSHDAALECADAELDTVGLGDRADMDPYISGQPVQASPLVAANDAEAAQVAA